MTTHLALIAAESGAASTSGAHDAQLIVAALGGIAVIVVLITWVRLHPFISLTIGALGVGIAAGHGAQSTVSSFSSGFGSTMSSVGILVGLGAMFGKLLADSGGADRIVDTLVSRSSERMLPWTMGLVGAIVGLPMFFEIGLVLLMPVIILVTRRSNVSLMKIAIPALAGLSAMHGLVPPHPGPLVAVTSLNANLGLTLAFGLIVAIPAVIIAGPLFGTFAAKWVDVPAPDLYLGSSGSSESGENGEHDTPRHRPSFGISIFSVLVPVALMLAKAIGDVVAEESRSPVKATLDVLGTPLVALGIGVLVAIVLLGRAMTRDQISASLDSSLGPIAGILLIVGAGGGFKQVLIDTGIGDVIAKAVEGSSVPVLLLAWLVSVLIRVATGSATVAIVTAAGILGPVAADLSSAHVSLMVLAIGSGSLFLSHVNDAGFWLVKEYLGVNVVQTLKTWSALECLISVVGIVGTLALSLVF